MHFMKNVNLQLMIFVKALKELIPLANLESQSNGKITKLGFVWSNSFSFFKNHIYLN